MTKNVFLTTKQVKLIEKNKFAAAAFDLKHKIFIIHIAVLSINSGNKIHPFKRAKITHLKVDKAPTKVFSKYGDFANIFLLKLVIELFEYTKINNHAIELVDNP